MAKNKTKPTKEETLLSENDFIVSKTDTKGIITYCNQIFMEMAGYRESELINTNHNIIRHPDMPKIAFKAAWDTIQAGNEFFAFVKNLRKDGGFYWVFTCITPDFDLNNNIIGYTSVRRKPTRSAIETIEPIYKQLVSLEAQGGMDKSGEFLTNFLNDNNTTYEELIIALQGAN